MNIIIGEEYVNSEKKEVTIEFLLFVNWTIDEITFQNDFGYIKCCNDKGLLSIVYKRKIPNKMIQEFLENRPNLNYFIGYFIALLPRLNNEIYKQKYSKGYLLLKPITFRDIFTISLNCEVGENTIVCHQSQRNIVPKDIPDNKLEVYIRDFLDSMTLFLNNDYENCVRTCITSLENYFILKGKTQTFRKNLEDICSEIDFDQNGKTTNRTIIYDNISFLYDIRISIVHKNLKNDFDWSWIELCEKGISSLNYIYENHCSDSEICDFFEKLMLEFTSIKGLNKILDLDIIEHNYFNTDNSDNNNNTIINSEEDFNDLMFQRVKFSDECKNHFSI